MVGDRTGTELKLAGGETIRLEEFRGAGQFGRVYRGLIKGTERCVAVKVLPIGEMADSASKVALLRELEQAGGIDHKNVVRVHEVAESPEVGTAVVMDFIEGGTLDELLRKAAADAQPVPMERAIELLCGLAEGAQAINRVLVHRDIKPDNILMNGDTPQLGDFGLSKGVDERTRTLTFKGVGHVAYMAPERWTSGPETLKVDVYSMGLVFYEVLALRHPIADAVRDKTDMNMWRDAHLFSVCPDVRQFRKEVPGPIALMLSRMVEKNATARPTWEEVLRVIQHKEPAVVPEDMRRAMARFSEWKDKKVKAEAVEAERRTKEQERARQFDASCETVNGRLHAVVERFNALDPGVQISTNRRGTHEAVYEFPTGRRLHVKFFRPRESNILISGRKLLGGGFVGDQKVISFNLLCCAASPDDRYGEWQVCWVRDNPIADPSRVVGQRIGGVFQGMKIPFGFADEENFYDHIRHTTAMHVFQYNIASDVEGSFQELFEHFMGDA